MAEKIMLTKAEINEVVNMLNRIQGEILAYTEHACELIDGCIEWLDDNHESAPIFPPEERIEDMYPSMKPYSTSDDEPVEDKLKREYGGNYTHE